MPEFNYPTLLQILDFVLQLTAKIWPFVPSFLLYRFRPRSTRNLVMVAAAFLVGILVAWRSYGFYAYRLVLLPAQMLLLIAGLVVVLLLPVVAVVVYWRLTRGVEMGLQLRRKIGAVYVALIMAVAAYLLFPIVDAQVTAFWNTTDWAHLLF